MFGAATSVNRWVLLPQCRALGSALPVRPESHALMASTPPQPIQLFAEAWQERAQGRAAPPAARAAAPLPPRRRRRPVQRRRGPGLAKQRVRRRGGGVAAGCWAAAPPAGATAAPAEPISQSLCERFQCIAYQQQAVRRRLGAHHVVEGQLLHTMLLCQTERRAPRRFPCRTLKTPRRQLGPPAAGWRPAATAPRRPAAHTPAECRQRAVHAPRAADQQRTVESGTGV
jgi:hypothetical protein